MYFLPDFGSAPILMDELASYLAGRGNKVDIITTLPRKYNRLKYKGRLYAKEEARGFYIKRFWTNNTPSFFGGGLSQNTPKATATSCHKEEKRLYS